MVGPYPRAASGSRAVPHKLLLLVLSIAFAAAVSAHVFVVDAAPPEPPVIIKALTGDTIVQPDGSYTTITHGEMRATNETAAHSIAQHRVEYSESMETAEILEAFTRKADGKILEADRTQIFPQAPPGSSQLPIFNDRKQKVIVFPDLRAEDTLVYTIKQTHKAPFAGQFFFGGVFLRGVAFEDVRVNVTLPQAMTAHVEVQGVEHRSRSPEKTLRTSFSIGTRGRRWPSPRPCRLGTPSRTMSFRHFPIMRQLRPPIAGWPPERRR